MRHFHVPALTGTSLLRDVVLQQADQALQYK